MFFTVNITSQGQISIPVKIRRELGFSKTNKALVSVENDQIIIKPVKDFLELGGSLKEYAKGKKPLSNAQLHEAFAQAVADEYAEKLKRGQ